jgi:DNA-binding MarR family transcriptional regulator
MSGGRLDLEDRQAIASGLAEGLTYAEIARRIGRPTSTVSREVARNGHRDYIAGQAQRATRRAARRHVTTAPVEMEDHKRAFVDDLASVLAATGMPRMASRVFASLITAETDTTTAVALVRELGVSPASVSKAMGYLEGMELAERLTDPGSRREHYRVRDDVWTRAIRADSSGHANVADAARRGLSLLGADSPAGLRLARMDQFFGTLTEQLRGNDLADSTVGDVKSVLAALGYSQQLLTARQLALALGWHADRLDAALRELRRRPALIDPFTVHESRAGYRIQTRPDRLSADQRAALDERVAPFHSS